MNVQQVSLTLTGVNVANYTFTAFSYNTTTHIAYWTLPSSINSDKLSLDLHATGRMASLTPQENRSTATGPTAAAVILRATEWLAATSISPSMSYQGT